MGKNKSTRSDGVNNINKTKIAEETKKMPRGAFKKAPQSPK
jgi:hypothetical protein